MMGAMIEWLQSVGSSCLGDGGNYHFGLMDTNHIALASYIISIHG